MSQPFDYYALKIKHAKEQVLEEIQFYKDQKYPEIPEYVEYLETRIGLGPVIVSKYQSAKGYQKMDMSEYSKDMNNMMFKKPWRNLNYFYKQMKMKQFIDDLPYEISENEARLNREYLLDEITKGFKNKKFGVNKNLIDYDHENTKISSISCIYPKKGSYVIRWKKMK